LLLEAMPSVSTGSSPPSTEKGHPEAIVNSSKPQSLENMTTDSKDRDNTAVSDPESANKQNEASDSEIYPSGPRFWAVVAALTLTMLLVRVFHVLSRKWETDLLRRHLLISQSLQQPSLRSHDNFTVLIK